MKARRAINSQPLRRRARHRRTNFLRLRPAIYGRDNVPRRWCAHRAAAARTTRFMVSFCSGAPRVETARCPHAVLVRALRTRGHSNGRSNPDDRQPQCACSEARRNVTCALPFEFAGRHLRKIVFFSFFCSVRSLLFHVIITMDRWNA